MRWEIGSGLRVGGHRGASARAPENTMASFAAALAAGVDYLELDVQLSANGIPMVFHDDTLERTSDGAGSLAARTAAELEALDVGAWFAERFAGERMPRLAWVLDWLARQPGAGATIEAKGPGTGSVICDLVMASPIRERLSICSFEAAELRAAAARDRAVPRLLIVDRDRPDVDLLAAVRDADATAVNVPWQWLDREAVDLLHRAGLLVAGGTVDEPDGVRACLSLGVDAIDSNDPARVVPVRDAAARAGLGSLDG